MNKNKAKKITNDFLRNKVNFTSLPKMLFLVHGDRIFPRNYKEILNSRWLINYLTLRVALATLGIFTLGYLISETTEFLPLHVLEIAFFSAGIGMISWFVLVLLGYTVAKDFFINREMKKFLKAVTFLQNIKEFNHILGTYLFLVVVRFETKKTITDLDIARLLEFGKNLGQAPTEMLLHEEYKGVVRELWKVLGIAHQDKKFSEIVFTKNVHNMETKEPLSKYLGDFLKAWKEHKDVIHGMKYWKEYQLFLDDIRGHLSQTAQQTQNQITELA